MKEAIIGLIGVIIGSVISWLQGYWNQRRTEKKSAGYLAIRVVCVLDKFIEDCADVISDDGLAFGQRNKDGFLEPQVKSPGAPVFPGDVDWKCIDQDLMYKLLSMPSEVDAGDRMIKFMDEIASPPNYEEWFAERKYHYSRFGLQAFALSNELSERYGIKKMIYNDWNPMEYFSKELDASTKKRKILLDQARNLKKKS